MINLNLNLFKQTDQLRMLIPDAHQAIELHMQSNLPGDDLRHEFNDENFLPMVLLFYRLNRHHQLKIFVKLLLHPKPVLSMLQTLKAVQYSQTPAQLFQSPVLATLQHLFHRLKLALVHILSYSIQSAKQSPSANKSFIQINSTSTINQIAHQCIHFRTFNATAIHNLINNINQQAIAPCIAFLPIHFAQFNIWTYLHCLFCYAIALCICASFAFD
jgi:hypothetical protein